MKWLKYKTSQNWEVTEVLNELQVVMDEWEQMEANFATTQKY